MSQFAALSRLEVRDGSASHPDVRLCGVRAGRVVGVPAGLGHCGEAAQLLRAFGLQDCENHLTADGAAMRGFLTGSKLRGLQVLLRDPVNPV